MPGPEDIDKNIDTANVVDNINDHTPDPETPAPVSKELDNTPEPPRPDKEGMDGANKTMETLAKAVETLEGTVSALVAHVTRDNDENPGGKRETEKRPWTAWGSKRKE